MNDDDRDLTEWLKVSHPDVLNELNDLLKNPPKGREHYDLVDHCDEQYSQIYHYYSEYS